MPRRRTLIRADPKPNTAIPVAQPVANIGRPEVRPKPGPRPATIPLAQPVAKASTAADSLAVKTVEETGFDPKTGRILDSVKFRKWQKAAHSQKTAVTNESLFEVFRKARTAIENWVDEDSRRPLILSGDMETIKKDAELAAILRQFQGFGSTMHDKLSQHLEFMVGNRRKYYAACR